MQTKLDEKRNFLKVRSFLEKRDGLTSEGVVLSTELVVNLIKPNKQTIDLKDYVYDIPVNTGAGEYELPKNTGEVMLTVEELEVMPEQKYAEFFQVPFEITTYRGKVRVSQEMIEDTPDVAARVILTNSERVALNTRNQKIMAKMKTFTAKKVTTVDDLKTLINKDLGSKYNIKLFLSESAFDYLDRLKDASGRYILKQDINTESGYSALRREVVVFPDEIIGTAEGDKVGFIGDAKEAIAFFNRKEIQLRWANGNFYGEQINTITRFDVQKVDDAAGYYVTFGDL